MVRLQKGHNRLPRRTVVGPVVIGILVTAVACSMETTPPAPPPAKSLSQVAPPVASVPQEERQGPAVYQSRGQRDPFRPSRVMTAEQSPTVRLTLTGIVREAHSYYALVEMDSTPGMGYVIRENDVVDSAKVVKITEDRVVFAVQTRNPEGKLLTRYIEKQMPPVVSR